MRRGDRVRIVINGSYRHYLGGLEGRIVHLLHHAAVVELDNDPHQLQKLIAQDGHVGPVPVGPKIILPKRIFPFHELEILPPPPRAGC
jgi:hypothetical protein